jgi:hypothetical protein
MRHPARPAAPQDDLLTILFAVAIGKSTNELSECGCFGLFSI